MISERIFSDGVVNISVKFLVKFSFMCYISVSFLWIPFIFGLKHYLMKFFQTHTNHGLKVRVI